MSVSSNYTTRSANYSTNPSTDSDANVELNNLKERIKKIDPKDMEETIENSIKKNEDMEACFFFLQVLKSGYKKDELMTQVVSLLAKTNKISKVLNLQEKSFVQFSEANHDEIKDRISTLIECAKYDTFSVFEKVQEIEPKSEIKKVQNEIVQTLTKDHLNKAVQFLLHISPAAEQKDLMGFMAYELSKSFSTPEITLARALAKKDHLMEIVCLMEVIPEKDRAGIISYIAHDLSGSFDSPEEIIAKKLVEKKNLIGIVYFMKYVPKAKLNAVMEVVANELSPSYTSSPEEILVKELAKNGHFQQLFLFMQYIPKDNRVECIKIVVHELPDSQEEQFLTLLINLANNQ